jgi:hypothetical protein
MIKTSTIGVGLVIAAFAWLEPAGAFAQVGSNGSTPGSALPSTSSMMSNPYLLLNPTLNPMGGQPMNGNTALLYLYAANNANGGLGTGRISGTRGGVAPKSRVAEMPYTAHPGGGASRYFNPNGSVGVGAGRYYNNHGRHFQNNGR